MLIPTVVSIVYSHRYDESFVPVNWLRRGIFDPYKNVGLMEDIFALMPAVLQRSIAIRSKLVWSATIKEDMLVTSRSRVDRYR